VTTRQKPQFYRNFVLSKVLSYWDSAAHRERLALFRTKYTVLAAQLVLLASSLACGPTVVNVVIT